MGLRSVMVDRAKIVTKTFGPRVNGETVVFDSESEWIKCRIDPDRYQERKTPDKASADRLHQFICLLKDVEGNAINLKVSDKLTIEKFVSNGVFNPQGSFEVVTVMKPRKVKKDILFVADVRKIEEY